ncbi:hypothetical protein O0L34_g16037 [Tuta absoluta]|nr:hypothetical protein O0L34_g16037 [Tuta absoluta]
MNLVEEFRAAFEKRLAEGTEQYHPKDLERVQDDDYLNRVLFIAKNDVKTACKMLAGILKWRKESGASDIHEGNIKMEYVNMALFFPLDARDKSGCRMMLVRCKNYIKGTLDFEEVKKILIYWLDRVREFLIKHTHTHTVVVV